MSWAQITLSRLAISVWQGKRDRARQGKGQSRPHSGGPRCCQESPLTRDAWPGQSPGTDTQPQGLLLSNMEQKHPAGTTPVLTTPLSTPSILPPHPESPETASSSSLPGT